MGHPHCSEIPIAVIGIGCRMPGANNADEFWKLLSEGRSAIGPLSNDRFDRELFYDSEIGKMGRSYTAVGGTVPDRPIDRSICPISDELLLTSDVAHQNICEVASSALLDAGMDPANVSERRTGVYIGHSGGSCLAGDIAFQTYVEMAAKLLRESGGLDGLSPEQQLRVASGLITDVRRAMGTNDSGAMRVEASNAASLIARVHGFTGPFAVTDAACASSLMAIGMAVQALQTGRIDMAVAGGASYSKWYALVLFSMAQSISATNSRPFDAQADGLISSDGYGAVVLKTLPKALADGDPISAVIRGIGISSDGRGKSLWAPQAAGQIEAVRRAYRGNITPESLQYIECHATSTQVGDATELKGLSQAFAGQVADGRKIPIGSVKANIGHALEAAGIAGMLKAILAMKHGVIPPQINFNTPNPEIDWANIPFEVAREPIPWERPADRPRRTAVNSFGIGGLNVHVVMDDGLLPGEGSTSQVAVPASTTQASSDGVPQTQPAVGGRNGKHFEPIAIVGSSVILPGALTQAAFWELLQSGRDPKQELPPGRCWDAEVFRSSHAEVTLPTTRGGYITDFVYDWKRHKTPPKQVANANPLQFMLLDAADQALADAGYDQRPLDRSKATVVVGTIFGGDFAFQLQLGLRIPHMQAILRDLLKQEGVSDDLIERANELFEKKVLKDMPGLQDETGSFTSSTLASRLSKSFDFKGGAFAMDADEGSSLQALHTGIGMLQTQASDFVLCAAGQQWMEVTHFDALAKSQLMSAGDAKSLFDAEYDGVLPGEGVAVVALKRLADAERDGDPIRAVINGFGEVFSPADANNNRADSAAQVAFKGACETGNATAGDIGVLELAGRQHTNDTAASLASELIKSRPTVPVVATDVTPQIGNVKGTAGLISVVKALLELEHQQVPPAFGLQKPSEQVDAETRQALPTSERPVYATRDDGKTLVSVNQLSTNGAGLSVLLESHAKMPAAPTTAAPSASSSQAMAASSKTTASPSSRWKAFQMGAATREALLQQLTALPAHDFDTLDAASVTWFNGQGDVRVGWAMNSDEPQDRAVAAAIARLSGQADARADVFVSDLMATPAGKLAGLFPGQGSQYPEMALALVASSPMVAQRLTAMNDVLREEGCVPFETLVTQTDVLSCQLMMLVADSLYLAAMQDAGLAPEIVCGHSYGEYTALIAAGVWDFRQAVRATRARAEVVADFGGQGGGMTSVMASRETVQEIIATTRSEIHIANINGPEQVVVGGHEKDLAAFESLLKTRRISFRPLAVPAAYHTPLMQPAVAAFRDHLRLIDLRPPQVTFLSGVGNVVVSDPEVIRENLALQLMTPMDFVGLVNVLQSHGVTTAFEVGPKQVLSKLTQRICPDHALLCVPLDDPKSGVEASRVRVQTALAVRGHLDRQSTRPALPQRPTAPQQSTPPQPPATTPRTPRAGESVPSPNLPSPLSTKDSTVMAQQHEIVHFDATARRKEANRQRAIERRAQQGGTTSSPSDAVTDNGVTTNGAPQHESQPSPTNRMNTRPADVAEPAIASVAPQPAGPTTTAHLQTAAPAPSTSVVAEPAPRPRGPLPERSALQAFAVEYIVDQTGYPEEMVELDADLEADLGIDSIKKAQMLGEMAQRFELFWLADEVTDLSLDEFPTLESIVAFLTEDRSATAVAAPEPVAPPTPVASPPAPPVNRLETPPSSPAPTPSPAPSNRGPLPERSALQAFAVEYIVDQTGYPEEMVELDADLEADLGIDSIKKAQMLGEMAQRFELFWLADEVTDLSLDEFPTLESIVAFLSEDRSATAVAAPESVAPPTPAPVAVTAAPETPAPTPPQPATPPSSAPSSRGPLPERSALQAFAVEYIVDQTGYPEEMVELDADLEADLGIDSIKKAQMLGEMAQRFELFWLADEVTDLSLDEFPTLESIVAFLSEDRAGGSTSAPAAAPAPASTVEHQTPAADAPAQTTAAVTEVGDITVVNCGGTPYQLGHQHGTQERDAIQTILKRQIERYGDRLNNMPELDQALADPTRYFGTVELEELRGIADGAELPLDFLVSHNLGLCEDYVPGCVQFAITQMANAKQTLIHGANEDSSLALSLGDCLKRIVQFRAPEGGHRHIVFSIAGQLAGLNGFNEQGLAVTSTLLLDRSPRDVHARGDIHPVLVKRILENASTIDDAIEILNTSRRNGAWSMCLSHHASDALCYIEYDADELKIQTPDGRLVGANHSLLLSPTKGTPDHSEHRLRRLRELLDQYEVDGVDTDSAEQMLRDQFDYARARETAHPTMNTVRRVDNQISVVMRPAEQEVRLTPGPMDPSLASQFTTLKVSDFFRRGDADGTDPSSFPGSTTAHATSSTLTPQPPATPAPALPEMADRVMRRAVLRPRVTPLSPPTPTAWTPTGQVLVAGDNDIAGQLTETLQSNGVSAQQASLADLAAVDWQDVQHVVLVHPEPADGTFCDRFVASFQLAQAFVQNLKSRSQLDQGTLTLLTFLGGDFGLAGTTSGQLGGASTGLAKALRREIPELTTRVIDFCADVSADRCVEQTLTELSVPAEYCEVAYARNTRLTMSAIPVPAAPSASLGPQQGTAWIVSGGARGVTSVVARELGRRYGLTLHLLGSSPAPSVDPAWLSYGEDELKTLKKSIFEDALQRGEKPINAWNRVEKSIETQRSLDEIRAAGVDYVYHQCDIASEASVLETVNAIRDRGLPIEGVIHGAGIEAACRFDKKKADLVDKTVRIKVDGAAHLKAALQHDSVRYFVNFASTSGRFGGLGQADYSAASDSLAKFGNGLATSWPDCRVVTFHWPPWDEVGMAARPESKLALEAGGMGFMPPLEGVAHVIDELCSPNRETEIVIVDKPDGLDLDATLPARSTWDDIARVQAAVEASPLLTTLVELTPGESVSVEAIFDPMSDRFLIDHQHRCVPILPMVVSLEVIGEAFRLLSPGQTPLTIREVDILNGLRFHTGRPICVRVRIERRDREFAAVISAPFSNRRGVLLEHDRPLLTATIHQGAAPPSAEGVTRPLVAVEPVFYPDSPETSYEQQPGPRYTGSLYTGPSLRGLTEIANDDAKFFGAIEVPPVAAYAGSRPTSHWATSPVAFDACLIGCDRWAYPNTGHFQLPRRCQELRLYRQARDNEPCRLIGQVTQATDEQITFDLRLHDAAGQCILEAVGYEATVIKSKPGATPEPTPTLQHSAPLPETSGAEPTGDDGDAPTGFVFPATVVHHDDARYEVEFVIDPTTEPLLIEHTYEGFPLLPGAAIAELFAGASRVIFPNDGLPRVRELSIEKSLTFRSSAARRVRLIAEIEGQVATCRLVDSESQNAVLASSRIDTVSPNDVGEIPQYQPTSTGMDPVVYPDSGTPLRHGEAFRCLKKIAVKRIGGWAELRPTPIESLLQSGHEVVPTTHPGVIDGCFFACAADAWYNNEQRVELPAGFDELIVFGNVPKPGQSLSAQFAFRDCSNAGSQYDVYVYDAASQPVYVIHGFRTVNKGGDR